VLLIAVNLAASAPLYDTLYSLPASCAEVVKITVLASDCFATALDTVKPSIAKFSALTSAVSIAVSNFTSTVVELIDFAT